MNERKKKIKIALIQKDLTLQEAAQRIRCTPTYLHMVICGLRKAPHIRLKISRLTGLDHEELWEEAA